MDFVNEKHRVRLQVGEDADEVTRSLDGRAAGDVQRRPHLVRHDVREGGLPEPRRAVEQNVVQRFFPLAGGIDEDLQVAAEIFLAKEFAEAARTQGAIKRALAGLQIGVQVARVHWRNLCRAARTCAASSPASATAAAAASASVRR